MFVVGADGCRGGWFVVMLDSDGGGEINVFADIAQLWDGCRGAALILVDIPIGLPSGNMVERQCDIEARVRLGPRRSSVFPPPCREALGAIGYEDACRINRDTVGKGLSLPAYGILPKIREVDSFLRQNQEARSRIREVHPELCFWAFNGQRPLTASKTTAEGWQERLELLQSVDGRTDAVVDIALEEFRRRVVTWDDILDAMAAALTAGCARHGSIPEEPYWDAVGLPMEMVFAVLDEG